VNETHSRRPALDAVPPSTQASIRAALARSLISPPFDAAAGELFRTARESARRERVTPAQLVDMIISTWRELADAVGIPPDERADRLAAILAHAVASVVDAEDPKH
jgi:hypothetical protein